MANDKWIADFQELMVRQSVKTLTPSTTLKKTEPHTVSFKLKEKFSLTQQCFLECRVGEIATEQPNPDSNAARIVVQFYDKDQDYSQKIYELNLDRFNARCFQTKLD